jgi:hypothetical protein
MSLADGAENKLTPPVRIVEFGAGPPVNHQGLGNALTPQNLAPPRPKAAPPTTVPKTPVTELAVAHHPAVNKKVAVVAPPPPTTTPPTTVPVVTSSDNGPSGFDAVAAANAERHHPQRFGRGGHRHHVRAAHVKPAKHRKHKKHKAHTKPGAAPHGKQGDDD